MSVSIILLARSQILHDYQVLFSHEHCSPNVHFLGSGMTASTSILVGITCMSNTYAILKSNNIMLFGVRTHGGNYSHSLCWDSTIFSLSPLIWTELSHVLQVFPHRTGVFPE